MDRVNQILLEKRKAGTRYDMVLVAEGAKPAGGRAVTKNAKVDSFGHESLGGIGEYVPRPSAKPWMWNRGV